MATRIPDNTACFTGAEIVAATGARGELQGSVEGVCLDSRRVEEGNLFVALRGESHDAHDYLAEVVERGAAALIVDRALEPGVAKGTPVLTVDDSLAALGSLAAAHRARHEGLRLVCVTGSVGKTTTKDLLRAALEGVGLATLATAGNLNNRVGVPMTLLTLDASHAAAVIELGMSEPGEIADLARMAAPQVGLVTAVAEVHTEGVGSIEGVAREKGALLTALSPEGAAIYNADEPTLTPWATASEAGLKIGFGRSEAASFRLVEHSVHERGTRARLSFEGRELHVELGLLGAHAAVNAAGALAAVAALEPTRLAAAAAALADVPATPQRMCAHQVGELLLVDDTYNASPRSMLAAFEACRELADARGGGFVAVLGDMLELGRLERSLHEEVGAQVIAAGAKALIACGERMTHAGRAALMATMKSGGPSAKVVLLRDVEAAADCVRELSGPRDVVLVKGSRGMRLERVVAALGGAS